MAGRSQIILLLVAATVGLFFASFSTFDFVQHLDRQMHDIHCSFVPGITAAEPGTDSGCQVVMMSPYSSVGRTLVWGGLPIALPAMAVFAFFLYRGVDLLGRTGVDARVAASVLVSTAAVPLLTSIVMAIIAAIELEAACKVCIGIQVSSLILFVAALLAWLATRKAGDAKEKVPSANAQIQGFVQLGVFVALPAVVYMLLAPDYSRFVGACGELAKPDDPYGVMVDVDKGGGDIPAIEVFDPLCPACSAFERRLESSDLGAGLDRKAVLFPLDDECNWMVQSALHPGACAVSEAMLCAAEGGDASPREVMLWAFENRERITSAAAAKEGGAASMVKKRFPGLKKCVGSASVRSKINKSLRWSVSNRLPVLTPQIYVDGVKLCDEDTDLGMDFALSRMLEMRKAGKLGGSKR
jgi:uncharacterized membrane protein